MNIAELLTDAFGRVREEVFGAVDGLGPEQLAWRADERANSIGWLVWHLTRVQDDHVADAGGLRQVWTDGGWARRFALPFDDSEIGYGQSSDQVAEVRVASPRLLVDYHDAVYAQTVRYLSGLTDADLDRVVDIRWDPPVTLGVRLVSVISDDLQHVGQAAFLRGMVLRRSGS